MNAALIAELIAALDAASDTWVFQKPLSKTEAAKCAALMGKLNHILHKIKVEVEA